jgi:hypothetical protein
LFFLEITTDGISTMANPNTNDSTKNGKYNMDPENHTPYFQIAIKPIVLIVTNQVLVQDPEATHRQTPSSHRRHLRHIGL